MGDPDPGSNAYFKGFQELLNKAHKKFYALRELPTYGNWTWEKDYHKAFGRFNALWKYQQDHRTTLIGSGLKRSDIGEIASKIGQLYYSFYLRTADTHFLLESYVFYEAIHTRGYFAEAGSSPQLSIKQLRFYARFIIVCLLLNKKEEAWNLLQEFQALISAYIMRFSLQDAQDWQLVIHEITTFMNADVAMPVPRSPGSAVAFRPNFRCCPSGPEATVGPHTQRVKEAVLVSYQHRQVKIAELPVDVFRMMQSLEWYDARLADAVQPGGSSDTGGPSEVVPPSSTRTSLATAGSSVGGPLTSSSLSGGSAPCRDNPAKQLLYRASVPSVLSVLASTASSLGKDDVLFVYLSGHGYRPSLMGRQAGEAGVGTGNARPSMSGVTQAASSSEDAVGAGAGASGSHDSSNGPLLASAGHGSGSAQEGGGLPAPSLSNLPEALQDGQGLCVSPLKPHVPPCEVVLKPGDLVPLTRRQLFLVVDSDASYEFLGLRAVPDGVQPLCLLCAPHRPSALLDYTRTGSLFAMFLSCPVMALCVMCSELDPPPQQLRNLQDTLDGVFLDVGSALHQTLQESASLNLGAEPAGPSTPAAAGSSSLPAASGLVLWGRAFSDVLLRQHMLRFLLCRAVMRMHAATRHRPECQPACMPDLPDEAAGGTVAIAAGVLRLAAVLKKEALFQQ